MTVSRETQESVEVDTEVPQVDLSAVPESHREFVDPERYSKDQEYKRAFDHGYKPKEVWVAEGGDPELHDTPKQFNKRFDDRQKEKERKAELREMKETLNSIAEVTQKEQKAAVERAIKETEAKYKQAKADGDIDSAIELKDQLNKLQTETPKQQNREPMPVRMMRMDNPLLDPKSDSYDQELDHKWQAIMIEEATGLAQATQRTLFLNEVELIADRSLKVAMKQLGKDKPLEKAPAKPPMVSKSTSTAKKVDKITDSEMNIYNSLLRGGRMGKQNAENYLKRIGKSL